MPPPALKHAWNHAERAGELEVPSPERDESGNSEARTNFRAGKSKEYLYAEPGITRLGGLVRMAEAGVRPTPSTIHRGIAITLQHIIPH